MDLKTAIAELDSELQTFTCRPRTLVPDLVLYGLALDVLESAGAVAYLEASSLPHRAYPNARVAFEGAQSALVLATHEDYERVGARAWVYFEWKDRAWRSKLEQMTIPEDPAAAEKDWLAQDVAKMAACWNSVSDGQGRLLFQALSNIRQQKERQPDNWLAEEMAPRQHRAYALIAASRGTRFDVDSAEVNEDLYIGLCRESHARPRFNSIAFHHDQSTGRIRIEADPRNVEQARQVVTTSTQFSVQETTEALRWQGER